MFSPETIQQVKALDFPSYLKQSGLNLLSTNGGTAYKALCPFHEDKNPSLSVTLKDKGWLWHCFGCNAGGDAIEFVRKREGLGFREAMIKLSPEASRLPILLPARKKEEPISLLERKRLLSLLMEHYHQNLLNEAKGVHHENLSFQARHYLSKRELLDDLLIQTFKIGFSDGTLNKAMEQNKVPGLKFEERSILYSQLGIFKNNYYETFGSSLVFPVFDAEGQVTELYARRVINYSDRANHCLSKGEHIGLWNFVNVKDADTVILTEGIIDALSIYKAGFKNVTALYGANGYTPAHEVLLKNKKCVIFALDNDEVGRRTVHTLSERLMGEHIGSPLQIFSVLFPEKHKDANGVLISGGAEILREFVCRALPIADNGEKREEERKGGVESREMGNGEPFVDKSFSKPLQKTLTGEELLTGKFSLLQTLPITASDLIYHGDNLRYEARNAFTLRHLNNLKLVVKVTPSVTDATPSPAKVHTDRVDFYAARSRKLFIAALCEKFEIQESIIENDLLKITEIIERHYKNKEAPQEKSSIPIMTEEGKREGLTFLKAEDMIQELVQDYDSLGYVGDNNKKVLIYLGSTSRKLSKPISILIRSQSSTGKSFLIDTACSMMPPEDVIKLTGVSPKALYYMEPDALKHKFLAIDERAGMEDAEYAIRSLQSSGKLSMAVPSKNPLTGKIETSTIEREGPIAYVDGSTDTRVNPENANRCFEIYLDETPKQTARIQEEQRKAHSLEGLKNKALRDVIRRKHQNAQRLLKSVHVVIPYAHLIQFPADWIRTRRDHDRFLNLIVVITFLHQYQRPWKEYRLENAEGALPFGMTSSHSSSASGYIEATLQDYSIAYDLASDVLGNTFAELDKTTSDFYTQLESMVETAAKVSKVSVEEYTFTRRQARNFTKLASHLVHALMQTLIRLEYVSYRGKGNGSRHHYQLVQEKEGEHKSSPLQGLTTLQELKDKFRELKTHSPAVSTEAHHSPTASTVVASTTKGGKK